MSDSDDSVPLSQIAKRRKSSSRPARASNQDAVFMNVGGSPLASRTQMLSGKEDLKPVIKNLKATANAKKRNNEGRLTKFEVDIGNMKAALSRQEHDHNKMEERLAQSREQIEVAKKELSSLEKEYESSKAANSAREDMLLREIQKLEDLPTELHTLLDGIAFESKDATITAMQRSFYQDILNKYFSGNETEILDRSDVGFAKPQHMDEDTKIKLRSVLTGLRTHSAYHAFAHPVSEDYAHRYFEYIKHPMDISRIRMKLESDQYPSVSEFVADANLMFNNCRTYNDPTSHYIEAADGFQQRMQQEMAKQELKWD